MAAPKRMHVGSPVLPQPIVRWFLADPTSGRRIVADEALRLLRALPYPRDVNDYASNATRCLEEAQYLEGISRAVPKGAVKEQDATSVFMAEWNFLAGLRAELETAHGRFKVQVPPPTREASTRSGHPMSGALAR